MANNGLLFVSNAAKAHSYCLKASKFVQKVLYIKINENSPNTLPVISSQISNIYSRVSMTEERKKQKKNHKPILIFHHYAVVFL